MGRRRGLRYSQHALGELFQVHHSSYAAGSANAKCTKLLRESCMLHASESKRCNDICRVGDLEGTSGCGSGLCAREVVRRVATGLRNKTMLAGAKMCN